MDHATLHLTSKDLNRNPVAPLVFDMQYLNQINNVSQYQFGLAPQGGTPADFILAGVDCVNFFDLLDLILSPNQPSPHSVTLATMDARGNATGSILIEVERLVQFGDGISLFGYGFTLSGHKKLTFMLTSTDAGSMFYVFDAILWSNPPNPPH